LVVLVMAGLTVSAQDFTRTFTLGPDGTVSIKNISGDVAVTGYEGEVVVVKGFREGRDRDKIQVVDNSGANRVDISVSYPERCDCDASIRFEVQVPTSVRYRFDAISSVSGDVKVSGVAGSLKARSVSGNVASSSDVTNRAARASSPAASEPPITRARYMVLAPLLVDVARAIDRSLRIQHRA
jgi:DUF4097 and DUF4098 domain-containing protein YvlB